MQTLSWFEGMQKRWLKMHWGENTITTTNYNIHKTRVKHIHSFTE